MKILIFLLLLYAGYRMIILPVLQSGQSQQDKQGAQKDDYIDYEEVE